MYYQPNFIRCWNLDRGSSTTNHWSGGNQSAHQRMINRRLNDRASCLTRQRPNGKETPKERGEDSLRLQLETANIRVPLHRGFERLPERIRQGRAQALRQDRVQFLRLGPSRDVGRCVENNLVYALRLGKHRHMA